MADTRCFVGVVRCGVTRLATWTPCKVEGEKSPVLLLDKAMKYGDLVKKCVPDQLLKFLDMSTARANRMRLKDLQDYLVWAAAHTHTHALTAPLLLCPVVNAAAGLLLCPFLKRGLEKPTPEEAGAEQVWARSLLWLDCSAVSMPP